MWIRRKLCCRRITKFFRLILRHDNLKNHYETNFALMQHHKYSLSELDDMIPWERLIYVNMLINFIEKENERLKQANAGKKR